MANALPAFIVNKIYVKDSLRVFGDGFQFSLNNSFAPVVILKFSIEIDGKVIEAEKMSIQPEGQAIRLGETICVDSPLPFSIHLPYVVTVAGTKLPQKNIVLVVNTRDAGEVAMEIKIKAGKGKRGSDNFFHVPGWLLPPIKARVSFSRDEAIGQINPYVYGQFIEHLERCVYGGLWTEDGNNIRDDVFQLVESLKMPLVRYPGGNFASGYHWEDGIGPKNKRPKRFDEAWSAPESNQVGTDEFLGLMEKLGAEPFLVVNDGSGTAEEAARWVDYCNSSTGEQAERRKENGHPAPYGVKIWGIGNEVWGAWQIGTTTPEKYARRLMEFSRAMRRVDPGIEVVAVGSTVYSDRQDDPGRLWNEAVLREAAGDIDYLSFHLYQPDRDGWQESYDLEKLHYTVCAAPLEAEKMIGRMAAQLRAISPERRIGVAFDEWNLWLTPPAQAGSMHQVTYTMRDCLYVAGMLNVFHRQCNDLSIANLAQLVNVLPLVVTNQTTAIVTPIYWPFWMYRNMEKIALKCSVDVSSFNSSALGDNIPPMNDVPYLDVSVTCSEDGGRLSLALINRHPRRKIDVEIQADGFSDLIPRKALLLSAKTSLATNSFDAPNVVQAVETVLPRYKGKTLAVSVPAASVEVIALERR